MARRKISDDVRDEMAQLRERGLSFKQIALKIEARHGMEISVGAVSYECLKEGADPAHLAAKVLPQTRPGPSRYVRGGREVRSFSEQEDALLLALSAEGIRPSEIGRRLARRHCSIKARLMVLARQEERRARAAEAA